MTSSEKHDCLEALYEELSAIQHTMNISRCWAGNGIACRNLDRREAGGGHSGHQGRHA